MYLLSWPHRTEERTSYIYLYALTSLGLFISLAFAGVKRQLVGHEVVASRPFEAQIGQGFWRGYETPFWCLFLGRPFGSPNPIRGWMSFDIL